MAPSLSTLLAADIPDPTDFPEPSTAPGLRQLDAALRCAICSELFEAPVILACGHCFCSLCARNVIADKPECPTCRKPANEGQLRPTPATEDAISAWKLARPYVLKLAQEEEARRSRGIPSTPPPITPRKRKRARDSSPIALDSGASSDVEILPDPLTRPPMRTTSGASSAASSSSGSAPDTPRKKIVPPGSPRKVKGPKTQGLVGCPICGAQVQMELINAHIDKGCQSISSSVPVSVPSEGRQKAQWSNIFGKGKERNRVVDEELDDPLPKVSYQTLKDKSIKGLLAEHKLGTSGDRAACIARHKRWVMLWNANLDRGAALRRPIGDLRSELKKWEDEQSRARASAAIGGSGAGNALSHEQKHDAEFKALIEKARATKGVVDIGERPPSKYEGTRNAVRDEGARAHRTAELSDVIEI